VQFNGLTLETAPGEVMTPRSTTERLIGSYRRLIPEAAAKWRPRGVDPAAPPKRRAAERAELPALRARLDSTARVGSLPSRAGNKFDGNPLAHAPNRTPAVGVFV